MQRDQSHRELRSDRKWEEAALPTGTLPSLPPELRLKLEASLSRCGAELDQYLMVKPLLDGPKLERKILPSIAAVRARIDEQRTAGKQILLMSGKFDLVHAGHLVFVDEAIGESLRRFPQLERKDLYVMLLADSDALIKAHAPATGPPRPIESEEAFRDITLRNPRLCDLAALDTDAVALIPLPSQDACGAIPELSEDQDFSFIEAWWKGAAVSSAVLEEIPDPGLRAGEAERVRFAVFDYLSLVLQGQIERLRTGLPSWDPSSRKRACAGTVGLGAWHLGIHRFLAAGTPKSDRPIIRAMSVRDGNYRYQAGALMQTAGIEVLPFLDSYITSTTTLLQTFGAEALLQAKRRAFGACGD